MDNETLKIAIAGFMHDIGKFADKDAIGDIEQYINDNAGVYLPLHKGNYSHWHALYGGAFIEKMKDLLPPELNNRKWGEGDTFVNLVAGHHNPETPMQQIISAADWITSGLDRDTFERVKGEEIPVKDYKKTRLLPLFEELRNPDTNSSNTFKYLYKLSPLSPESIFPKERADINIEDAKKEYIDLYNGFISGLKKLRHRDENISLWFEHFESLLMIYASFIPAARVGNVVHDVSLYDHCRLTSAFAAALYLYHRDEDRMNIDAIKNWDEKKFLMVSGNVFGIQGFIFSGYGDTRKYRSKILRGRSFYVSLLSELAADMLCRELGLPAINIILNAAGRFTVLAPNTENVRKAIEKVRDEIKDWLMKIYFGEISMGFSQVEASCNDFSKDDFSDLWLRMGDAGELEKFNKIDLDRHGGAVKGYTFNNKLDNPLCPLCGKRPSVEDTMYTLASEETGPVCKLCRDYVFLGTNLVKRPRIIIGSEGLGIGDKANSLMEPLFGRYQLAFSSLDIKDTSQSKNILKYWDISMDYQTSMASDVTRKIINAYVPEYKAEDLEHIKTLSKKEAAATNHDNGNEIRIGEPKSLDYLALMALGEDEKMTGTSALGVLKADVDDLGMLMSCGLKKERLTISRLFTLSRQLNYYFSLYLPHLFTTDERFRNIYTVFAGGDDLFLIGPWNRIYELSLEINRSFSDYACGNPAVHLSSGLALQKAHTPLPALAESAEEALERSKSGEKNSLTMFEQTATWRDMEELEKIRKKFDELLRDEMFAKTMFYRLNGFIDMAQSAEKALSKREVSKEEMQCLKWRPLFYYSGVRNFAKKIKDKQKKEAIVNELIAVMEQWVEKYGGELKIPLWNVLYNNR